MLCIFVVLCVVALANAETINIPEDQPTFQLALARANAGDEIILNTNVTLSATLVINKEVTISSTGFFIESTADPAILVEANNVVLRELAVIVLMGSGTAIEVSSASTITNLKIESVEAVGSTGLNSDGTIAGLDVSGSLFLGQSGAGMALENVTDATITRSVFAGLVGFLAGGGDVQRVTIELSDFEGFFGLAMEGIDVTISDGSFRAIIPIFARLENAVIKDNFLGAVGIGGAGPLAAPPAAALFDALNVIVTCNALTDRVSFVQASGRNMTGNEVTNNNFVQTTDFVLRNLGTGSEIFTSGNFYLEPNTDPVDTGLIDGNTDGIFITNGTAVPDPCSTINLIPGEQGERGTTGATGNRGDSGPAGFPGPPGSIGDMGETGTVGGTGATGFIGDSGDDGAVGDAGFQGPTGISQLIEDAVGGAMTFCVDGQLMTDGKCPDFFSKRAADDEVPALVVRFFSSVKYQIKVPKGQESEEKFQKCAPRVSVFLNDRRLYTTGGDSGFNRDIVQGTQMEALVDGEYTAKIKVHPVGCKNVDLMVWDYQLLAEASQRTTVSAREHLIQFPADH